VDVPACKASVEEVRRSIAYDNLVRAQRRYAEKVTSPTGPTNRFTKEEWDALGDDLQIDDWEGGFLIENAYATSKKVGMKKENISSWKGKEKAVEMDSDDEDAATLMMVF
jgi:hypothetical protein